MLYIKVFLILGLFVLNQLLSGQESFELKYSSEENEFLYYTFQNSTGNYISLGGKQIEFGPEPVSPLILNISSTGEIISENIIIKEDTSYSYRYGFEKSNGNYFLIGTLTDSVSPYDYDVTYVCEMTPELDLVWEKLHPIPAEYIHHSIIDFLITPDSNILIQGKVDSSLYGSNDLIYIALFDMNGEKLDFVLYENWTDYGIYNELIYKPDSSGFYLIGDIGINYTPKDWLEFDNNLNIVDYGYIENWLSYLHSPVSAKWLSNGNMIIANNSSGITIPSNQDLEVRIVDQDFNMIKDTIIYYSNEYVYIPTKKGLGFIDENTIWIATFEAAFLFLPGTEVFNFHIFDSNLNLKGVKQYGGDKRYWFFDLTVTNDGGCLLTGMVPDYEGSYNHDAYIIKVMPEDIFTFAEETPFDFDRDVLVFPNPFSTEINIQTVRKNLTFNIFDVAGKLVLSKEIDQIPNYNLSTGKINPGFYFYTIQYKSRTIQSGKLIKE
ncbi:MAG: T9SS type A sorting domain-containing protein [Bacteroidetes bacterium]|nr:T9SS type A sorting domain-containing protein [Bacteroidota bacterium]MBL7105729.1 T9SS type A sorting domain-containing protein [Bacteroidales bacterium]